MEGVKSELANYAQAFSKKFHLTLGVLKNDSLWLPGHLTWDTLDSNYPDIKHFIYVIPIAILFWVLRWIAEKYLFLPFARLQGYKIKRSGFEQNLTLEKIYKEFGGVRNKIMITTLSKELEWTDRKVERWFRKRRQQDCPTKAEKISECCWRIAVYTFMVCLGFFVISDRPYFNDPILAVSTVGGHGHEEMYYLISISLYVSLLFTLFSDVKRKDFTTMLVHHAVTLMLLSMSAVTAQVSIGTLVLLCHDLADVPLEVAKFCSYTKRHKLADSILILFLMIWIVTRLYYFPLRIITAIINGSDFYGHIPYISIVSGLLLLVVLHVIWTSMIIKTIYHVFLASNIKKKDYRSFSEDSSDDNQEKKARTD